DRFRGASQCIRIANPCRSRRAPKAFLEGGRLRTGSNGSGRVSQRFGLSARIHALGFQGPHGDGRTLARMRMRRFAEALLLGLFGVSFHLLATLSWGGVPLRVSASDLLLV